MKLNISHRIIIISVLPALITAAILTAYFMLNQFSYITDSLNKHGNLIAKQLSPSAEYAVYSGNTDLIKPLIETIIQNEAVIRIQIQDKYNNNILDIKEAQNTTNREIQFFDKLFNDEKQLTFSSPILSEEVPVDDDTNATPANSFSSNKIGNVVVTLTTYHAIREKVTHIKSGAAITLIILLIAIAFIIKSSYSITKPIKSLTNTVRNIAAGNLDTVMEKDGTGEIGILQSCIVHMTEELKHSQSDMENQLSEYTHELQQTMEELEIRNAELDITRSKAIYASNAKSEFLANMSHEIRTPLSGIIGFTELLRSTSLTEQQEDYASTIQKSSKNLLEIINDILDLSKIESGKTEISTSEFNLINIIEDIINLLSPTALEKNIELFYRIDKTIPASIKSDPFRIHQILTNLIGNAIKFTDEGYVYLQVTLGEIDNNETSLKFSVSDTGIGMSSSDKKKLFKAFTQADTSITRRFGGTGLGLVISRKLTLLMNGEIGFDSTESEGSTFWFSIPVIPVPEAHTQSDLANKKVALISNHFIATQTFKTHLDNAQCLVNDYTFEELTNLAEIERHNDIIVLFLSRKDIISKNIADFLSKLSFSIPSLLIASTPSHKKLRDLQQNNFDSSVFTSEKIERVKQKIFNTINRNASEQDMGIDKQAELDINDWSKINILVVDDNEVNLRLAEIILHKNNARVTTAMSGAQAIDYACMNSFDIIFMDLHMPGIDGYETTKKIREITPGKQPVIIALTANALTHEKENVIKSGMNGILIKPVSDAILQKVINQWILKEPINISQISEHNELEAVSDSKEATTNNKSVFSIERAKEFTGNNEELAYELFTMLRAELNSYSEAIAFAMNNNDLAELYNQAHKLHGASRCCGTEELQKISSHIENLINQNIKFDIVKESRLLLKAISEVESFKL